MSLQVGQLILDKYGRLGMIVEIDLYTETGDGMIEVEWLSPRHGSMLIQPYKAEEQRFNFLCFRNRILGQE